MKHLLLLAFAATLALPGAKIFSPAAHAEPAIESKVTNAGTNAEALVTGSATGSNAPPATSNYVADDKYKLRPGDRVSLRVMEDNEPAKSLVIADSGELDVPYLGRVPAADKSCKELAAELKTRLEKDFYYRATVVLALDLANKSIGRVYVWGQVRNQGALELIPGENLTAGKAVLRAGGFADFANKKRVKVVRAAPATPGNNAAAPTPPTAAPPAYDAPETFVLNLTEVLEDGKTEKDLPLRADDLVIVPSRLLNF